jgi:uncharacterized damage-inducible protein DinB
MQTIHNDQLIHNLKQDASQVLRQLISLQETDAALLQQQPLSGGWSIATILAHLNFYNDFYLNAINRAIAGRQLRNGSRLYKPGWLGAYFVKLMKPLSDGQLVKRMKAPKNSVPKIQPNGALQLNLLIQSQEQLLQLLDRLQELPLGSIRIPTSLSPLIRLKLGDTVQFLIAHQQRHMLQAGRCLQQLQPREAVPGS